MRNKILIIGSCFIMMIFANRSFAINPPVLDSLSVVNDTEIDLTWTKGADANKILIMRASFHDNDTAPEGDPVDYEVGDPLGSHRIIYIGEATSFKDTGLNTKQTYYYRGWMFTLSPWGFSKSGATLNSNRPFAESIWNLSPESREIRL